jgi:hypothetical protein
MEGRLGNVENARALFAKGIEKAPNHVSLYQGWALLELREEDFGAAKALITQALTRDKVCYFEYETGSWTFFTLSRANLCFHCNYSETALVG